MEVVSTSETSVNFNTTTRFDSSPWRWRQYAPPKRRSTSTWLHGATSQKTMHFILANMRTRNLKTVEMSLWGNTGYTTRQKCHNPNPGKKHTCLRDRNTNVISAISTVKASYVVFLCVGKVLSASSSCKDKRLVPKGGGKPGHVWHYHDHSNHFHMVKSLTKHGSHNEWQDLHLR
jgi:hypothetical protein